MSAIESKVTPGRNCQRCGAFVSLPEVLPFHNCKVFKATHPQPTRLELLRKGA